MNPYLWTRQDFEPGTDLAQGSAANLYAFEERTETRSGLPVLLRHTCYPHSTVLEFVVGEKDQVDGLVCMVRSQPESEPDRRVGSETIEIATIGYGTAEGYYPDQRIISPPIELATMDDSPPEVIRFVTQYKEVILSNELTRAFFVKELGDIGILPN